MFEYKDAAFFNNYFKERDDYSLKLEFQKITTQHNGKYYVGYVECVNTIHPLELRIEIPIHFPHQKLTIWTASLFGYPHIINTGFPNFGQNLSDFEKKEQEKTWSWFCLNAPFAEEVEEQLNQELEQLHLWIKRMLKPELPPRIEDAEFQEALRIVDPVNWNNPDRTHEFNSNAKVTFVGEDFQKLSLFKKDYSRRGEYGVLKCLKNDTNKIYVFNEYSDCNYELPYVLVDESPTSTEDFLALRKQYNWSDKIVQHLLPFSFLDGKPLGETQSKKRSFTEEISIQCGDTEAEYYIKQLEQLKETLQIFHSNHKELVHNYIDKLLKRKKETGAFYRFVGCMREPQREDYPSKEEFDKAYDEWETDQIEAMELDHKEDLYNAQLNNVKTFVLGVVDEVNDNIDWYVLSSRECMAQWGETQYDIELEYYIVKELESLALISQLPNIIRYEDYFGRGAATENLTEKKVAIIGLGAIGSQVAEALARCGVKNFGLWDKDIIEPGNLCRASYERRDIGDVKANAAYRRIKAISPFANIITRRNGIDSTWNDTYYINDNIGHHLYGNINYQSQEDVLKELEPYDIIIDCTASNNLLHFLSYAIKDKLLLSLCITNRSKDLLCFSNADGNCFELRKIYLSKIEQDTKNYYHEGSGCYSPTFLASYSDIATLVNLAIRDINTALESGESPSSVVWSYDKRGVVADRLKRYSCDLQNGNMVSLIVPTEAIYDAEDMEYTACGPIGYIFGAYSRDCTSIMITHFVPACEAENKLNEVFYHSHGLIDYLGDFEFSCDEGGEKYKQVFSSLEAKALAENVNVNNPILAMKNIDGTVEFYLYFNGKLLPFIPV